jgi:hypothetical protein
LESFPKKSHQCNIWVRLKQPLKKHDSPFFGLSDKSKSYLGL